MARGCQHAQEAWRRAAGRDPRPQGPHAEGRVADAREDCRQLEVPGRLRARRTRGRGATSRPPS
eukprot:15477311-Alexandrium_andersonii.AAC.1